MSLDLSRLEKPRMSGGKMIARCPACAETGDDTSGDHLFINSDGKFGCVLYQSTDGTEHRKRIFEIAGIAEVKQITEKSTWAALPSAPEAAPFPSLKHYKHGLPVAHWIYRTADGLMAGIVARFNLSDGRKETLPLAWCRDQSGRTEWRWKSMPDPRTLYALPFTEDFVVIVEGEKCAEAVIAAGIPATTWAGGSSALHKTDWTPLTGKTVVIWPDADEPGRRACASLIHLLTPIVAGIRLVNLPPDIPAGWDAADTSAEEIRRLVDQAVIVDLADLPQPEAPRQPQAEDAGEWAIPANVFPVPAGGISLTDAAKIIFPVLGATRKVFMRGGEPAEVSFEAGVASLAPLNEERLQNVLENCGHSIKRREKGTGKQEGMIVWRKTIFPIGSCRSIMENDQAKIHLPMIKSLSACPIMNKAGEILAAGYHKHAGGVFITKGKTPPAVPFEPARQALWNLLGDFLFTTPADKSRAIASLISPALKMGGWITDDFPLDVAEATKSQSGKTYRQVIIQRIYNEQASVITPKKGGVGSVDEDISTALISGRPFILLDNFRGKLDSPILESAIRGAGSLQCRGYRAAAAVDTRPFLWQLSTNGAELTRDLANRSIITRIRKQPDDYKFKSFPEGDLEAHVIANQPFFVGCVFAVLREWRGQGCPSTNEHRHSFRGWCQSLDWIVQNLFSCPPLLDGHREEQQRVGNPNLQWLRDIILAASSSDIGKDLNTGQFLRIADDAGIEFPGNPTSKDAPAIRAGRILGTLFRDTDGEPVLVDGFKFSRSEAPDYSSNGSGEIRKFYTIEKG